MVGNLILNIKQNCFCFPPIPSHTISTGKRKEQFKTRIPCSHFYAHSGNREALSIIQVLQWYFLL